MTYNQMLASVVKQYLVCQNTEAFSKGKPTSAFWGTRNILIKQDPDVVRVLYDMLTTMKENNVHVSFSHIYDAIDQAKHWQQELRWKESKEQLVKPTEQPYSIDMFLGG